jgi:hypothetical protein
VDEKMACLQVFTAFHSCFHRCGRPQWRSLSRQRGAYVSSDFKSTETTADCGKRDRERVVYTPRSARHRPFRERRRRETHLPAERTPPKAATRVPRADDDACGSRDPETPPRERAQASLRLRGARPCNAVTGYPAQKTSTPSTGADRPPRRATSSCTGSHGKRMPPVRRAWDLRCRGRWARRSFETG